MRYLPILTVLFLSLISGCNPSAQQVMQFQVNPSLIGEREQNHILGISYAAPASFTRFSEEQTRKIQQSGMQQQQEGVEILSVYQDERTQAFMILSEIDKQHWQQLRKQMDAPQADEITKVWQEVKATTYEYNDFKVQQWLMQNEDWIDFKLMYEAGENRYFQVDYLVPTAFYDEIFAKTIESSIGSFKTN